MILLKVRSGRPGYKFMGAYFPTKTHNYLTLFTLAKGISKTKILKNLVDDWAIIQRKTDTEDDLIKKIIHRANAQWKVETKRRTRSKKSFNEFIQDLKEELANKGLDEEYIKSIIIGVER